MLHTKRGARIASHILHERDRQSVFLFALSLKISRFVKRFRLEVFIGWSNMVFDEPFLVMEGGINRLIISKLHIWRAESCGVPCACLYDNRQEL